VITNTGGVTLNPVNLSDNRLGVINCPASVLAPGDSETCTAVYPTTQLDLDAGVITNIATATGQPPSGQPPSGPLKTDHSTADVGSTATAHINVVKTAAPTTFSAAGQPITYAYEVTNSGKVTLDTVTLSDNKLGQIGTTIGCAATAAGPFTSPLSTFVPLAPGASVFCQATHVTTQGDVDAGGITNIVTAAGNPATVAR
jgi:hypothetical protein